MVQFHKQTNQLLVTIGGKPFATCVFHNPIITRPYFAHVKSPHGIQVTRHHPPIPGQDSVDHATFHPGIWMAFADINGNDYWRLKAKVASAGLLQEPQGGPGRGRFALRNYYLDKSSTNRVCTETAQYEIRVEPKGYLLIWDSTFFSDNNDFTFGDQEEFGLGIRLATPIAVKSGGKMTDSAGRINEKAIWGTWSDWVDCRGIQEGRYVGLILMPDPGNFRQSWYHARDYGLIVANPFGRKAMKAGDLSAITVKKGDQLRLRYGILIYSLSPKDGLDINLVYQHFLNAIGMKPQNS
jgi:hypothetical protein